MFLSLSPVRNNYLIETNGNLVEVQLSDTCAINSQQSILNLVSWDDRIS